MLLKRKQGLTMEQFRNHYDGKHVPLVKKHLGHTFKDYVRHFVQSGTPEGAFPGSKFDATEENNLPYDVVTVITFKDDAALKEFQRLSASPDVGPIFEADDKKFLDTSKLISFFCDPSIMWGGTHAK
jgi:hypothetical protein